MNPVMPIVIAMYCPVELMELTPDILFHEMINSILRTAQEKLARPTNSANTWLNLLEDLLAVLHYFFLYIPPLSPVKLYRLQKDSEAP
jgi:hypothetical protein